MTAAMPRISFSKFLHPNVRPITLADDQDANLVGMRWYGGGPFHRELKEAQKIQKKSHFAIRKGDVIYNKLFAWKGAFGIVPDELDGMFVSDKFPTYELDRVMVEPRYLSWYFRHDDVWEQARLKSTGSAAISKLTLNPPQFLDLDLPLPQIDRQIEIADLLDNCASKIHEARALRLAVSMKIDRLVQSAANVAVEQFVADGRLGSVLLRTPRNGWSPKCDNLDNGIPVLTLAAVTGWRYNLLAFKRTSLPTTNGAQYWLERDDLLITRSNTPELVGHVAIYNGEPSPCIYPDLMMKLAVDHSKASTKFVWWWMQTERARGFILKKAKGSSPTMKKISQSVVMDVPFPSSISVGEQKRIVAKLDELQAKIMALKPPQGAAATDLGALLPAILDKAFSGEL